MFRKFSLAHLKSFRFFYLSNQIIELYSGASVRITPTADVMRPSNFSDEYWGSVMFDLCCCFCVWSGSCPDDFKVYRADGRSRVFQTVSSGEILPRLQNRSVRCYSCIVLCVRRFVWILIFSQFSSLYKANHYRRKSQHKPIRLRSKSM